MRAFFLCETTFICTCAAHKSKAPCYLLSRPVFFSLSDRILFTKHKNFPLIRQIATEHEVRMLSEKKELKNELQLKRKKSSEMKRKRENEREREGETEKILKIFNVCETKK